MTKTMGLFIGDRVKVRNCTAGWFLIEAWTVMPLIVNGMLCLWECMEAQWAPMELWTSFVFEIPSRLFKACRLGLFSYLTCRSLVTADRWYKYNVRVSDLLQNQICVGFIEARASFPSLFYEAMIICRTRIGTKRHRPASCLLSSTGGSGVAGGWAHTMYELLTSLVGTLIFQFPCRSCTNMLVKLLVPVFDSWTMQIVHVAAALHKYATTSVSLTLP